MKRKSVRKYYEAFGAELRIAHLGFNLLRSIAPVLAVALAAFIGYEALSVAQNSSFTNSHIAGLTGFAMAGLVAVSDGSKELVAQRNKLATQMLAITSKAKDEKRGLNSDETEKWNKLNADLEALDISIKAIDRTDELHARMSDTTRPPMDDLNADSEEGKKHFSAVDKIFTKFMKQGFASLNDEEKQLIADRYVADKDGKLIKAAQTVTTTGGGYLIPQGFSGQLEEALKWYGGMYQAAELVPTETGNPLPWPTVNDTANVGELLGINTAAATQDFTFGQIVLGAFKYSSKLVLVPIELLQDSFFDLNTFLARKLGERLGRITNTHFTVGTGGGAQPNGIVPAATLGKTGLTGQTLTVIYDDLVDLFHSIDPAHRMSPGCKWMLHDSSIKVIKKLKDTTGRPLWQPGVSAGVGAGFPDTILDKPYVVNNDIAVMAANAKSILFGDLSKYKIRQVMGFTLLRLVERYAEFGQVGFLAFMRADGNLIDAGSNPVKYYINSAT